MIIVGDDFKIDADKYQYILLTRSIGKDKDGNEKEHWNKTFHASIQQCCNAITDTRLKESIQSGIVDVFISMANSLSDAVKLVDGKGE